MAVELLERAQGIQTQAEAVGRQPGSFDAAVDLLLHRAQFKDQVIFEGSPIYLYPNTDAGYMSQAWDHEGLLQGWTLVTSVCDALESSQTTRPRPFVLIDEFNNLPEGYTNRDFMQRFARFIQSSPVIEASPIAKSGIGDSAAIYRLESEYTRPDDPSFNVCSTLDAQFQKEKFLFERDDPQLSLAKLRSTLLVVAHPVEFKHQQSLMLASLLGEMKKPPFHRMSKEERRTAISELYMHVWLDDGGNVESVTRPVWDGDKFAHQELE